jgi:ABC-type branched-subunit amino acid transport system ATPase component
LRDINAYYGQARVLSDISLSVQEGQTLAILGTNGAGKTALANVISGTLAPASGQLLIDGRDLTGHPPHHITRQGVAQVMEGRRIFANLSVEENLLLTATNLARGEVAIRLEQAYALFPDLRERRKHGGTSMSGGQQQMLAIARALMSGPRLILFDEISLGLAPVIMDRLYAALADLKQSGMTMVIVEQDVERALALADKVHVIEHGSMAFSGSAHALHNEEMLRALYIGENIT